MAIDNTMFNFNNEHGYLLNVNHPKVHDLLVRYKKWKGLPLQYPLSDKERLEFEAYVLKKEKVLPGFENRTPR